MATVKQHGEPTFTLHLTLYEAAATAKAMGVCRGRGFGDDEMVAVYSALIHHPQIKETADRLENTGGSPKLNVAEDEDD